MVTNFVAYSVVTALNSLLDNYISIYTVASDRKELKKTLEDGEHRTFTWSEVDKKMSEFDTDGSGKLSLDEFKALMVS